MTLFNRDFIFLDFQTTGTVAARSEVIEAGWGLYRAESRPEDNPWTTHLIALPEAGTLSRTIQRLTGLAADFYLQEPSISDAVLQKELLEFLSIHESLPIVIHFAQFKLPFLWKILGAEDEAERLSLLDRVICVHKLSRLLIPELKSFSLRAVAGYAGYATAEKKRSIDHLLATAHVWRFLAGKLAEEKAPPNVVPWLKAMAPRAVHGLPLHDAVLRKKRLALPRNPGVYFFLDRFENILYIGKAADLKARVNSYFRGRKTKGSRLNEMLTRAVDFRYVEVASELEALLRENDEIKSHDPPYNRMLRVEGRGVHVLRFNDLMGEPQIWGSKSWGPLASAWMVESLKTLFEGHEVTALIPTYRTGISAEMVHEAIGKVFQDYGMEGFSHPTLADWRLLAQIAWPIEMARLARIPTEVEADEEGEEESLVAHAKADSEDASRAGDKAEALVAKAAESVEWTTEDLAAFLNEACRHLFRELFRSRWYLRLCDCRIEWEFAHHPGQRYEYEMQMGQLVQAKARVTASYADRLRAFDMQVFDRVRILYSELRKGLRRGDKITLHLSRNLRLDESQLKHYLRC